jgi:hypothetical protein
MFKIICIYLVLVVCNQDLLAIDINFDYQYAPEVPKSDPMPRTTPSPPPQTASAPRPTKVRMPTNAPVPQFDADLDLFKAVKNVLQREVIIICKALKMSLVFTRQIGYDLFHNNNQ